MSIFQAHICCHDCGAILNSSIDMDRETLNDKWSLLVISSGLVTGKCPKGCRATFSDCNINTDMKIFDVSANAYIDKDEFFGRKAIMN